MAGKISIIIPVLNEAGLIVEALTRLRRQAGDGAEIVVVDGGSSDRTVELAAPLARVISGSTGRAAQLNAGARAAGGPWLVFLHVDTVLPGEFPSALRLAEEKGHQAGVFRLRIMGRHPLLPMLSRGANQRTRWRGIFLGDQAPFIRQDLFFRVGGFPEQKLLEDLQFSLNLKKAGVRVYLSPLRVETAGRRWEEGGFFATWWQMRRIFHAYRRGGVEALAHLRYLDVR